MEDKEISGLMYNNSLSPDLPYIPQSFLLDMQKLVLNDGQRLVECFPEEKNAQPVLVWKETTHLEPQELDLLITNFVWDPQ